METKLYSIDVGYACYGIVVNSKGFIVRTPPIAKWMLGKHLDTVQQWVYRKCGTCELVNTGD